ncbi:hypothetical protein ACH5RR_025174 [Cinchona calisaya]|uniref:Uncharacterized protein n=1 Tax=Cinchona calisaya TaxID=153742 RepID=A0ABD2YYV9_9GENT
MNSFLLFALVIFDFVLDLAVLIIAIERISSQFSSLTCEDSGEIEQSGCEPGLLDGSDGIHLEAVYCFGFHRIKHMMSFAPWSVNQFKLLCFVNWLALRLQCPLMLAILCFPVFWMNMDHLWQA